MTGKRICVAIGTRPEASKMAPVVYALREQAGLEPVLLVTGQHFEQLEQTLKVFALTPQADLKVMRKGQSLPELIARIVPQAASKLKELKIDYVLVHGDTLTTFAVALASYFEGIPLAHVEAGLRSFNLKEPFPEEANRRLTDVLTDLDLPPTAWAKTNLLKEGKCAGKIIVTGNTAVDAVHIALDKAKLPPHLPQKNLIALTMHRRENLAMMPKIASTLAKMAKAHPSYTFVYPVHLNPIVRQAVYPAMANVANIILDEPYDYTTMLALLKAAELIITDSGGIQEEGVALNKPVVVLRNVTERPEGVEAGLIKLAGNDPEQVEATITPLLTDKNLRQQMQTGVNPYGDGQAGKRVSQAVAWRFGLADRPVDWHYAS